MTIAVSTIKINTATGNGGGIYVNTSGSLTMSGGTIGGTGVGNTASLGGGVYALSTSTLSGALIEDNTASGGGGGGIQTAGGTTTIQNTTIKKNKGFDAGGGIHVATGGTVSISKSAIDQTLFNFGGRAGGFTAKATFNAKETSITANTATIGTSGTKLPSIPNLSIPKPKCLSVSPSWMNRHPLAHSRDESSPSITLLNILDGEYLTEMGDFPLCHNSPSVGWGCES